MSELKAYNVVATADVNPDVVDNLGCTEWPAYDKEEADKVIAEKDAEIAQLQAMLEERNKQVGELKGERRWRKCCEGLPLAQQRVLFLAKYKTDKVREWIGDFRHIDGMKVDFAVFYASAPGWGCEFLIDEVIGWMPMPSAPKEAK